MKKVVLAVIATVMVFQLCGCYEINTSDVEQYETFLGEMNEKGYCTLMPKSKDGIVETVLYYTDYDLLDSFFMWCMSTVCGQTKNMRLRWSESSGSYPRTSGKVSSNGIRNLLMRILFPWKEY